MKKFLLFVAGLLSLQAYSQITITQSDFPQTGDSYVVSTWSDDGSLDFTVAGANHTWDFSSMVAESQDTVEFISASNTSLPVTYIAAFNNFVTDPEHDADVAKMEDISSPMPTITFENYYSFYKVSSDAFIQVGMGVTINSAPLPVQWNPTDSIVMLPAAYGNQDTCFSSYSANIPSLGYYSEQRTRYNTIDGWGTLKTPFGTFDALRILSYSEIHDSLYYDAYGIGFPMDRTETEYKWYAHGYSIPVLQVVISDGMSASSTVTYIDSLRNVAVEEEMMATLNVYPNPSSDEVFVNISAEEFPLQISIFDAAGREMTSFMAADNRIDVSLLPAGIYFMSLTGSSVCAVSRFVVE
ncbi:hypothetical protein SDC9_49912 [bioreactor metagenome]|uniref:Secretion system C-terminal sorting domain-containing protein n=1 Tax=bioreactor metagenome TaxID=1076179 RepID=A0A644WIE6_9ZZZZ